MKLREGQIAKITGVYLPLLLFIANLIFKLFFIEKRDVSIDEPYSIFFAQKSISDILSLATSEGPNPPVHILMLHFWIKIFGNTPFSVRFLSLLFNSFTVVVVYFAGKKCFNVFSGLTASLLFIFSFYNFFHGLEARTYALFVFGTALSLLFYLNLIKKVRFGMLIGLALSDIFMIYSHYFGWFIVLVQFIGLLIYWENKKLRYSVAAALLTVFVSFIPMVVAVYNQSKLSRQATWIDSPVLADYLKEIILLYNAKPVVITFMILLILGSFLVNFTKAGKIILKRELLILFLWWFIPYTLMFILSYKMPMFNSRYIHFTSIGLYLFSSVLISYLYESGSFRILAPGIFVSVMALNLKILPDDFGRREIEDTVQFVKSEEKQLKDRVILLYPGWSDLPFMYYYDRSIFNQPYNFNNLCNSEKIIKVWSSDNLKEQMAYLNNSDIVMVVDRSEEDASVFFDILRSSHKKISAGAFPETYSVGVFIAPAN